MKLSEIPIGSILAFSDSLKKYGYSQFEAERRLGYVFGTWYTAFTPTYLFPLFKLTVGIEDLEDLLLHFLYCCEAVPVEQIKKIFGDKLFYDFCNFEVFMQYDGLVESMIQVVPLFDDLLVATEPPVKNKSGVRSFNFDTASVMTLFPDTYDLARRIRYIKSTRALDIFCGNGVQALVLAKNSQKVIGVDVNEKALDFARFNAILNRLNNIEFRYADVSQSMKDLGKFDVVVANPPFCPFCNSSNQKTLFCDGGPSGDNFLGLLLRDRLAEVIEDVCKAFVIFSLALKENETTESHLKLFHTDTIQYDSKLIDLSISDIKQTLNPLHSFLVYFVASRNLYNHSEYEKELKIFIKHFKKFGFVSMSYNLLELENISVFI